MTVRTRLGALAGVAGIVLACPMAAQAATKVVSIGPTSKDENTFNKVGTDVNDFFPHGVKIHVGDSVRFVPAQFHTVDFPPKGGKPLSLVTPGPAISGVNDEAGAPFWFNGQPQLSFTPALVRGIYGKKVTYTGAKRVESGLPLGNRLKAFTVKFKRAGSYTYYCDVHAGMKGKVTVRAAGKKVPTAKQDTAGLKKQRARDLKIAKGLSSTTAPVNTVSVGASGAHGVEFYGMFPNSLTVPVGTVVTFRMSAKTFDVHTASFGPGDPERDPNSFLGKLAASFLAPVFDQRAVYPSEAPGTTGTLTPTAHGNGFWNTGIMDGSSATPLPNSGTVKFGAPGTYNYYCLIHPFMHGTIVVQ